MSEHGTSARRNALLAALALGPGAWAASECRAQTLDETLASAQASNPTLEDAALGVRAAREDRLQAIADFLPEIDVDATYGLRRLVTEEPNLLGVDHRSVDHLQPSTASARVTQQLYAGGRRSGQMRLARATSRGAEENFRSVEQDVVFATISAFLRVRRDFDIAQFREAHVVSLNRQLEGTRRRLEFGEVTRTDLAQAESRLAGAIAALATARAALEGSRATFLEVVGMPADAPSAPLGRPPTPDTLEAAMAIAEANHPDLGAARQATKAARARVSIERAALLPELSIVGRFDHSLEQTRTHQTLDSQSAVAQFTMPLFEGGFAWSRTRQSQINARRAETQFETQRRRVLATVISRWNNKIATSEALTAAMQQVAAADVALSGTEREQGLGLRSTIDVLDAERDLQDAQIALASAQAEAVIADYALLAAIGGLTFDVARSVAE